MLSAQRAERLVRRAERVRGDGSRGVLARRAWRKLSRACERGDDGAVEAVWRGWLRRPDGERWEALCRWRGAAELVEQACAAVLAEPAVAAVAVAAFCVSRGLAPADPARRVVFFLLSEQREQYRAADPDGSLLAAGYANAAGALRQRLRAAMAAIGDLDLVRVVARTRSGNQPTVLTDDEIGYLSAELTGRKDWARLWDLAQSLPIQDAVRLMRRFAEGWRPSAERERALFGLLLQADPARLDVGRAALRAGWISIPVPGLRMRPVPEGAMSATGHRLALVTRGETDDTAVLAVFRVPDALLAADPAGPQTYQLNGRLGHVMCAFDGDALYVSRLSAQAADTGAVACYSDGQVTPLDGLDPVRSEFLVGLRPRVAHGGGLIAATHKRLLVRAPDGTVTATRPLRELAARDLTPYVAWNVATGPGGLVAVATQGTLAVFDITAAADPRLIGRGHLEPQSPEVVFCAPGRIVTKTNVDQAAELRLWELEDERLELRAVRKVHRYVRNIVPVPDYPVLACWAGQLWYLDASSLEKADPPPGFPSGTAHGVWGSPDFGSIAIARDGVVEVYSGHVVAIVDRPAASWSTGDLGTVMALLAYPSLSPEARSLLELVRDCLEYRFGGDVALGSGAVAGGADDIALADSDWPC